MKMYDELASWWPLLSPAADYEEEGTMLEIGSSGGHNASHLKRRFAMVLVEPSVGMRAVSSRLNPECAHVAGDMRDVRLGRQFDAVFVHDAVCYMTTLSDLRKAIDTVYVHCRPGGVAVVAPDHVRENFRAGTDHGGDDGMRGLRYLEWTWDPDPTDTTYVVDYAYLLRGDDGRVSVEHDRHIEGLFARAEWIRLLSNAGFETCVPCLSNTPRWNQEVTKSRLELLRTTKKVVVAAVGDRPWQKACLLEARRSRSMGKVDLTSCHAHDSHR